MLLLKLRRKKGKSGQRCISGFSAQVSSCSVFILKADSALLAVQTCCKHHRHDLHDITHNHTNLSSSLLKGEGLPEDSVL